MKNCLNVDPQFQNSNDEYNDVKVKAINLKMINDFAKRTVKLIEDDNSILTKNEDQKQYILQLVADYRKTIQIQIKIL